MLSVPASLKTMKMEYDQSVCILTLDRPDAMNAINRDFLADFQAVLSELASPENPARALLITATGKGFCAGADLKDQTGEMPPQLGDMLRRNYNPLIKQLKALPLPTLVAMNGVAAGAGMSLMCACDITLATDDAYFLQAFINIALIPDAGSTYFLPRLVGRARAAAMMMLGEKLSAQDAHDFGIIAKITPADQLQTEALALAHKLAAMPTRSVVAIRHLLDASEQNNLEQQLEAEAEAQQKAGLSSDFLEGVTAFLQKRPANFTGK